MFSPVKMELIWGSSSLINFNLLTDRLAFRSLTRRNVYDEGEDNHLLKLNALLASLYWGITSRKLSAGHAQT